MSTKLTRDEVIARLKSAEPQLRARGVGALYLYGSYARDEARDDSDIDVFVDLTPVEKRSLVSYLEPYFYLQQSFPGTEIGYGTRNNIAPVFLPYIENSAVQVF